MLKCGWLTLAGLWVPTQLLCHSTFSGAKNQFSQAFEEKYEMFTQFEALL